MKPLNSLLVKIDNKPLQDEIELAGGLKLYLDPSYNPAWNSTVSATLAKLPKGYRGKLREGDEVAMSFRVVSDRSFVHDGKEIFYAISDENPHFRKYQSNKGTTLQAIAFMGIVSVKWAGTCVDRYNNFIDGVQGSEHDLDRWMSKFAFAKQDRYKFNNLVEVDSKQYWKCDTTQVFAKKVNGRIISVGDRIICKPIEADIKDRLQLINDKPIPFQTIRVRLQDRAYVVSGGEKLGLKEGDVVGFDPKYKEAYTLWGEEYYLIKTSRALGKWQ